LYCPCHFLIFGFVLPFQQISAIKEILTTISVEVENNTSFDQINNMPGIRIDQYSKSILPERTIVPLKLMHYVVLPNITSASRNHFAPPSSVTQLLTIDSSTHSKLIKRKDTSQWDAKAFANPNNCRLLMIQKISYYKVS
jgi:hypothetical protein